ncbi:MAG: O-antigen ligase domain-containing protein, partial [Isosphaeraceae bacterium]
MNPRPRILALGDSATGALLGVLILGSVLCFGGAVWWFRPVMVAVAFLLVAIKLTAMLAEGRMLLLKSPLGMLGLLALLLGIFQLVPLPPSLASQLSPTAHETYARGVLPRMVQADMPDASLPEAPPIRSPASLDRSATLRWLA